MRVPKAAPILGLAAAAAYAEPESACGVSTIYMTVPASPVTKTITVAIKAPISMTDSKRVSTNFAGLSVTSTDTMATATNYMTLTSVFSIAEPSSKSTVADQGPYSFNVNSGTTSWFGGKTPSNTGFFATSTRVVTLVPVPKSSSEFAKGPGPTPSDGSYTSVTSYTTTFLTTVTTKVHTETITESVSSGIAIAKIFSGLGSSGWNMTYSTLRTIKISGDSSCEVQPAPSASENAGFIVEKLLPLLASVPALVTLPSSKNATQRNRVRQIGAVIDATIDGVAVSWTNNYSGSSATTSAPKATPDAPMATSSVISPLSLSSAVLVHPSSVVSISNILTSVPTTTLPIYPWNLSPFPTVGTPASSSSTSAGNPFGSGWIEPGIPSMQPSYSSVSLGSTSTYHTSQSVLATSISYTSNSNITTATNTAATVTASCISQSSDFTINFDDLPRFSTGPTDTDVPPILNPYYKLFFEAGFGYVPPSSDPYSPISSPQLAVYRNYDITDLGVSPGAGLLLPGEIGAGPRASESAYWIDAYSAYLGCDNGGSSDCTITINGYKTSSTNPQVSQVVTQRACTGLIKCRLGFVKFSGGFRGLSGVQFLAAVDGEPVNWYLDDLALGWSNNSCAAQLERSSAH